MGVGCSSQIPTPSQNKVNLGEIRQKDSVLNKFFHSLLARKIIDESTSSDNTELKLEVSTMTSITTTTSTVVTSNSNT